MLFFNDCFSAYILVDEASTFSVVRIIQVWHFLLYASESKAVYVDVGLAHDFFFADSY